MTNTELSQEFEEKFCQDDCGRSVKEFQGNWQEINLYAEDVWSWFESKLEEVRGEEIQKIKNNIGFLRQWINEKPNNKLVTNHDIEEWLLKFNPQKGNKK